MKWVTDRILKGSEGKENANRGRRRRERGRKAWRRAVVESKGGLFFSLFRPLISLVTALNRASF